MIDYNELKEYLKNNLWVHAELEDGNSRKRLVITLGLVDETISGTKIYI